MQLVRNLPAYRRLGESGDAGGVAVGDLRHGREGLEDIGGFGPDGDVFHGVVIGHLGFVEAVGNGGRGEVIDCVGDAVAVAEPGRVAGTHRGDGVATDVDRHLHSLIEELRLDEGVHLDGLFWVGGLVWKADVAEQAVWVVDKVFIETLHKVFRSGSGFGMASDRCKKKSAEEC